MKLNTGLGWDSIALRVGEAYEKVAPSELTRAIAGTITIPTEVADLSAEEIDPLMQPKAQKVLKQLAEICAELPETSVARQFGKPVKNHLCASIAMISVSACRCGLASINRDS